METSAQRQKLVVSHLINLNNLVGSMLNVLDASLRADEKQRLAPIRDDFDQLDNGLRQVMTGIASNENETPEECEIHRKVGVVKLSSTLYSIAAIRDGLISLSKRITEQSYPRAEVETISHTIASLKEALDSNIHLIERLSKAS